MESLFLWGQAQIIILAILPCIPACPVKYEAYFSGVVKIFAFLDLVKTISFSDNLLDLSATVFPRFRMSCTLRHAGHRAIF
jgi:hypothetical protein